MSEMYQLLLELTKKDPEKTLFIEPVDDGYTLVSRQDFLVAVEQTATLLQQHGIGPNDCVATWLPNWSSACAWQFAASALGAHAIGVNTRYNIAEVGHVIQKARPKVIAMAHGFQRLDLLSKAQSVVAELESSSIPAVVPVPGPGQPPIKSTDSYDLGGGVWNPSPTAAQFTAPVEQFEVGVRLAVAFTTSGSTGMPKLAAHSERSVVAHALADAEKMDLHDGDVLVAALPYSGVFGYNAIMATVMSGAVTLLHPVFDEKLLVKAMSDHAATHFPGGDDMLGRVMAAWKQQPVDLSSWRRIFMADLLGQTQDIARWAADEFGTVAAGIYGSTEVFALAAFWSPETELPRRWNGGGYPVSESIQVRIADPVTGEVLEHGDGEIQLQGPNVVDAYLGDDGEGAEAFTADGWFHTGDLGALTDDGGFRYICRMGDVLRLRGFLVQPAEIEGRLASHDAVETARVVGIRDDDSGETTAVGFVTLEPSVLAPTGEELRNWCQESLARFKVPSIVHIIDQMPMTAGTNGSKIRVASLRKWAKERSVEEL